MGGIRCLVPALRCAPGGRRLAVEIPGPLIGMATQTLAPLTLDLVARTGRRRYAVASLGLGFIAFAALLLLIAQGSRLLMPGLVQKIATDLWVLVLAILVLQQRPAAA